MTLGRPGECRLHHVGYLTVDLQRAVQQFSSRFGYEVESEPIQDPVQTAIVQFVRLPGADHWLEFISPHGDNSKLARAAKDGVNLHHLCYEVDNIELMCSRLQEQGMFQLSKPVEAVAFSPRRIAWFMDRERFLVEIVEAGTGPLSCAKLI